MLTRVELDAAVRAGIIDAAQRDHLLAFAAGVQAAPADDTPPRPLGEDNLRLIGGGNDLFVTVGIVLLSAGVYFALAAFLGKRPLWIAALLAAFFWAVAEFVTRQKRMRLSSTVLGVFFLAAAASVLVGLAEVRYGLSGRQTLLQLAAARTDIATAGWLVLGGFIVVATLYFWRFRVPIMAGAIAVAVTCLAFLMTTLFLYDRLVDGSLAVPPPEDLPQLLRDALYMPLVSGLVVFAVAVGLDLHDRERRTVWSDCAFWLHVVSAPLLVHPLFIMATGQEVAFGSVEPSADATIMLVLLILVFVYVALAIDRRSLLVPTLAYFGTLGIYYLVDTAANVTGVPPFALILLVIGGLIMVFGAGWQRIRSLIVRRTLPTSVTTKLPPFETQM